MVLHSSIRLIGFFLLLVLGGCNCKPSFMAEVEVAEPTDNYLNCQQLVYAINEVEFSLRNVADRCSYPYLFANFIGCTGEVKRNAAKNELILWERKEYLQSLYKLKKCKLHLNNLDIAAQATTIAKNIEVSQRENIMKPFTVIKTTGNNCSSCKARLLKRSLSNSSQ